MSASDDATARRVELALAAHARGWALTPLRGKEAYLNGWQKRPPPTREDVVAWATAGNLGIRTGPISGVLIVDVDVHRGGTIPAWAEGAPRVRTGKGGVHVYFAWPAEPIRNSKDRVAPGVEILGDGKQAVYAGSVHPETRAIYTWEIEPGAELPPFPADVAATLRASKAPKGARPPLHVLPPADHGVTAYGRKAIALELARVRAAQEGRRNEELNGAAFNLGQLHAGGQIPDVRDDLEAAALEAGLGETEARKTIVSGWGAGMANPRTPKPAAPRRPRPTPASTGAPEPDERPELRITTDMPAVINAAESAVLDHAPGLYQRGGVLVHVARDGAPHTPLINRPPEAPTITIAGPAFVRERFSAAARWMKFDGRQEQWVSAIPPTWAVAAFLERGDWRLPRLEAVIEWPTLRLDGSVLDRPGYDEGTGLLFQPNRGAEVVIPANPSREEAAEAAKTLLDPFAEFAFKTPEDRVAVLAAVLTVVARHAIDGPVPMFAVRSTVRGSGKSLLVRGISTLVTGRDAALNAYSRDDDETRKVILAICLEGHPISVFDNIEGEMGSPSLAQMLTSGWVSGRVLGESRNVRLRSLSTWFATGNNIAFTSDLGRRVVPIDFEPDTENPEDRTGFRYADLLAHVAAERSKLLAAALTILRAHAVAGRPAHGLSRLGSFEAWDDVVRSPLIWCGAGDPCKTRLRLREEGDSDRDRLRTLQTAWREKFGDESSTVAGAIERSKSDPDFAEALAAAGRDKEGKPHGHRIGHYLRLNKGRIVDGLRFQVDGHDRNGAQRWLCAGNAGNAGNDSVPAREMADPISDGASDSLLGRAETTPAIHAFPAEGETPPRWPVCPICAETDRPAGSAAGCRTCRQFLTAMRELPPDPRDGPAPGHSEDPRWS